MGVALLNTRARDVIESEILKSQMRAKGMFSEYSCLVIPVILRVFETSAGTLARNHVAGKIRGGRASVGAGDGDLGEGSRS